MKCACPECNGAGVITCPDCDGIGSYDGCVSDAIIDEFSENYLLLISLKEDVASVRRQAERLKELNPAHADSYEEQLQQTIAKINERASALI